MAEEATQTTWLSGRPRRVLTIRPPPPLPDDSHSMYFGWSFKDDQILVALPPPSDYHDKNPSTSTIYLADIQDGLSREDDTVEFKFYAAQATLLSDRTGFLTVEFRSAPQTFAKHVLAIKNEEK
jgi:hypothetical protein